MGFDFDLLADFFDRVVGMFIFIAAVGVVVASVNSLTTSVSQVKETYVNDEVYQESALAVTDESTITRDELIALVMGGPEKNITIKDEVSGMIVRISGGPGISNIVKYQRANKFSADAKILDFGRGRWDPSQLALNEWFQSDQYTIHNSTDEDGNVESVFYYGRS